MAYLRAIIKDPKVAAALLAYKTTDYAAINTWLLQGSVRLPLMQTRDGRIDDAGITRKVEELRATVRVLDKAIGGAPPLDRDVTVYRGMAGDMLAGEKQAVVPTFVSTSFSAAAADEFASGSCCRYAIVVPRGTRALVLPWIPTDGSNLLNLPVDAERELLLPRGCTFRLVKTVRTSRDHVRNGLVYRDLASPRERLTDTRSTIVKHIRVVASPARPPPGPGGHPSVLLSYGLSGSSGSSWSSARKPWWKSFLPF